MIIVIIVPSKLTVPAVNGGAIETLIQNFIDENEIQQRVEIIVVSPFSQEAFSASKTYFFSKFIWVKRNNFDFIFKVILKAYNFINRIFLTKKNPLSVETEKIKRIIKNLNYDFLLIEGNGNYLHHFANIVPKSKLFFHIHSYYHCNSNKFNKYLMELPCKIISVSDFIKNSLVDNLSIDANKIITVKNCIGKQFFNEFDQGKNEYVIDKSKLNIVFTGRIVKEKGIIELVRALSKLKNIGNWHLHIIGSFGSSFGLVNNTNNITSENEIKYELSKIEGRYTIHGYVSNKVIPNFYNNYDLALAPSICKDAAPLVIGEYISSGIPIIASDQGGIPEYLDNECGVIVGLDDDFVEKLSLTIKNFLENDKILKKMSENCIKNKLKFSSKIYYDKIIEVLVKNSI